MTAFWIAAAALALLAWSMLMLPGLGRSQARRGPGDDANLRVLKEQLAALDAELAAGVIDSNERRMARADIERRVLEEGASTDRAGTRAVSIDARPSRTMAVWLGLGIPVIAFGIYGFLGQPEGALQRAGMPSTNEAAVAAQATGQPVESMLDDMVKRMEAQGSGSVDAAGWALVARAYAAIQRYDSASRAYALAVALAPDDAQLRTEQARTLAAQQGEATAGAKVDGTVRIAPELAARVLPTDSVFVFAREAGGAGPPLAAARYTAAELPLDFMLDENGPMRGARRLSQVPNIVIGARISRSGDALPQSGDLKGESAPVGADRSAVEVTIRSVQP